MYKTKGVLEAKFIFCAFMKILLLTDQFYDANNGLTISARRFAKVLKDHGNDVRIASYGTEQNRLENKDCYIFKKQYIPIFDNLITSQGMTFAKTDDELLTKAIQWADIVHFLSPFALTHHAIKIAKKLGVPYTGAFHVQPENITSSIHMGNLAFVNSGIYAWFNHYVYKYCPHVHCPSNFIANELKKHKYTSSLHVISNGIDPDFKYMKEEKPEELKDRFVILMIGRLSIEKRQDVLIDAVKKSKYSDKIQLILAGKGPRKKQLYSAAKDLPNPIIINFFSKQELLKTIASSDLYVHAAEAEIEAMSCMEAFACGLVPIIANSKKSATPQFALDDRSLFECGNSDDLACKIDYWIEHKEEKAEAEIKYAKLAEKYNLDKCVREAEIMFSEAIKEVKDAHLYGERAHG